jgi:hypothetical protein
MRDRAVEPDQVLEQVADDIQEDAGQMSELSDEQLPRQDAESGELAGSKRFWPFTKTDWCKKCKDWYDSDRRDTSWLAQLNSQIRCPCSTKPNWVGHEPADKPSSDWERDGACLRYGAPLCWLYHPGADGCLRSKKTTSTGARQQCCYSGSGQLIRPGGRAAGTPDRASNYQKHQEVDVEPYSWCCNDCKKSGYCGYYLEMRKGNADHCR